MTEIRIRHELDPSSVSLGDVPFFELERVTGFLKRWGISYDYDSDCPTSDLSAQFVIADGAAFFEIIIGADDD